MKRILFVFPEPLMHDFKALCALSGKTQKAVVQELIEQYLETHLKNTPALKSLMEKFSRKIPKETIKES